jgi:hypothetical protein
MAAASKAVASGNESQHPLLPWPAPSAAAQAQQGEYGINVQKIRHVSHNQGGRRKELARSCRRDGDGPTRALPPRRRAVTRPSQLETPPARGHANVCLALKGGYELLPPASLVV